MRRRGERNLLRPLDVSALRSRKNINPKPSQAMMLNVAVREDKQTVRQTKEASLWRGYRRKASRAEAEAGLVEQYLPLVKTVVGRLQMSLPSHVDAEDL